MSKLCQNDLEKVHAFANTLELPFYLERLRDYIKNWQGDLDTQSDILWEVITYLGISKDQNPYYHYATYLKKTFPDLKKRHVIEIACGILPALSIACVDAIEPIYPILAIDPCLSETIEFPGIQKQVEDFHSNDLLPGDFVMSIRPNILDLEIASYMEKNHLEGSMQLCSSLYYLDRELDSDEVDGHFKEVESILKRLEKNNFKVMKEWLTYSKKENAPIYTVKKRTLDLKNSID